MANSSSNHDAKVAATLQADRQYLISSQAMRRNFVLLLLLGIILLFALLIGSRWGRAGHYVNPARAQYEQTRDAAAEFLTASGPVQDNADRVRIPIQSAIQAVAHKGIAETKAALSAVPVQVASQTSQSSSDATSITTSTTTTETSNSTSSTETTAVSQPESSATVTPATSTTETMAGYGVEPMLAGEAIYNANCLACHQMTGEGLPGAFPPLKEHAAGLIATDRDYVAKTVLYGLQGPVRVKGMDYNGVMPAWQQLSDEQLADTLNYVATAWDNNALLPADFQAYTAEEIANHRGLGLSANDVHALRPSPESMQASHAALSMAQGQQGQQQGPQHGQQQGQQAQQTVQSNSTSSTITNTASSAVSSTPTTATSTEIIPQATEVVTHPVVDSAIGEKVYQANCLACHQAEGQGIPGAFPNLVGHMPELYRQNRDYLPQLLLYGLQGDVEINGVNYNGAMPAWNVLSDEELAGVLNYGLQAWGNDAHLPEDLKGYSAEDIASHRSLNLSPQDVFHLRQQLGSQGSTSSSASVATVATQNTQTTVESPVASPEVSTSNATEVNSVEANATATESTASTNTTATSAVSGETNQSTTITTTNQSSTTNITYEVIGSNIGPITVSHEAYDNCVACHQVNGKGIITVFPSLVKHAVALYQADRSYLPNMVLYGLEGEIKVDGISYRDPKRGLAELSDDDIAAVLNYILTEWDNQSLLPADFNPYTAQDIAANRGKNLSASDIYAQRQALNIE